MKPYTLEIITRRLASEHVRLASLSVFEFPSISFPPLFRSQDVTTDEKFHACRTGLRFLGLVASIDPDRDGVPESVEAAHGAGIRVVMITGNVWEPPGGHGLRRSMSPWSPA